MAKCLFQCFKSLPNSLESLIWFEFIFKKLLNLQIDEDILQEVIKMGFDRAALVESLRNRVQNEVTFVAVSLLTLYLEVLLILNCFFRVLFRTICC